MTPTPPPNYAILTDYTKPLPQDAKCVTCDGLWIDSDEAGSLPIRGFTYAVPLSAEETTVSANAGNDQRAEVGTRIIFLETLEEGATDEHPGRIYARKGDGGFITKVGDCKEGYWVLWDGWKTAAFGAELGKDFRIDPAPAAPSTEPTPPSAPTQETGSDTPRTELEITTAQRDAIERAFDAEVDFTTNRIATLECELKEAREERDAIARMIGREPDEIESGDLLSAVSSMKMAIEISGKQFQENQNALAESERKRGEQNGLYEHDLETERNRTKALQSELSALQAKVKGFEEFGKSILEQFDRRLTKPDALITVTDDEAEFLRAALSPNPTPEKP